MRKNNKNTGRKMITGGLVIVVMLLTGIVGTTKLQNAGAFQRGVNGWGHNAKELAGVNGWG